MLRAQEVRDLAYALDNVVDHRDTHHSHYACLREASTLLTEHADIIAAAASRSAQAAKQRPRHTDIKGCCNSCGYPAVVVRDPGISLRYGWYCSNPSCSLHGRVETTIDKEWPSWVSPSKE